MIMTGVFLNFKSLIQNSSLIPLIIFFRINFYGCFSRQSTVFEKLVNNNNNENTYFNILLICYNYYLNISN